VKGYILKTLFTLFFVVITIISTNSSYAKSQGKKEKRRTSINFEDELIQGEVKRPELFYLLQKKQFNFKRLIKLRTNFLPEMRQTAEDLPRGEDTD